MASPADWFFKCVAICTLPIIQCGTLLPSLVLQSFGPCQNVLEIGPSQNIHEHIWSMPNGFGQDQMPTFGVDQTSYRCFGQDQMSIKPCTSFQFRQWLGKGHDRGAMRMGGIVPPKWAELEYQCISVGQKYPCDFSISHLFLKMGSFGFLLLLLFFWYFLFAHLLWFLSFPIMGSFLILKTLFISPVGFCDIHRSEVFSQLECNCFH